MNFRMPLTKILWKNINYVILGLLFLTGVFGSPGCGPSQRAKKGYIKSDYIKIPLKSGRYSYDMRAGIIELVFMGSKLRVLLGSPWVEIDGRNIKLPSESMLSGFSLRVSPSIRNYVKNEFPESKKAGGFLVVIDPGHGGKDPGAMGNGLKEKDVVLDVAKRLKAKLSEKGIKTVLTRDRDVFITLKGRARKANKLMPDVFVSIHANASRRGSARGVEVYYVSERVDDSNRAVVAAENSALKFEDKSIEAGKEIKAIIWDMVYTHNRVKSKELAGYIAGNLSRAIGTKNRGVKGAPFYVLKWTNSPAVLVEIGFISNPKEASKLGSNAYKDKIADAICKGILQYLKER